MEWSDAGPAFEDRRDAGRRLAARVRALAPERPAVLALPRGGVPVGFEIASALGCPLDVAVVRKIGAPGNPELAIGAVVDGDEPVVFVNSEVVRSLAVPIDYVERASRDQIVEIERRRDVYLGGRPRPMVAGRTCIVVDDGIATGSTARAASRALRAAGPSRLVLAVPVAPRGVVDDLAGSYDEIVVLETPAELGSVGRFYRDFRQVEDVEVIELLNRATR
ncbi:phosphoribosyltransferase [Arenibaculum sp.]|jgi:putative phosphoribosyl transferase|uniref:phosphoribosyltransferase n=1 Tax=Arenibaculum sp. TaxID=2865862 RepID=UPI002E0D7D16|nr:phosphoribosyltransferase family protein [Arenibaculum sp.]